MSKIRVVYRCSACLQEHARWAGRCPGCGEWGSIEEAKRAGQNRVPTVPSLLGEHRESDPGRILTGIEGLDRVLGGGLVPGSVVLLAGEPGIGKSTFLLQLLSGMAGEGDRRCLLVSGEESGAQVAGRARRLGVDGSAIHFAAGRDLAEVLDHARAVAPLVLAVDSIQSIRDPAGTQLPGGVAQVRMCADALVGFAKAEGVAVILTGHVTKDGDLAGPRALEHAVDVVLSFDGDPRSGLRVLSGGKNRFGAEGETAWFEMTAAGLRSIDPAGMLMPGGGEPGAAVALPKVGRRALAVEIQALVGSSDGPARRQATGVDLRRFQQVAAVLDRVLRLPLGRTELFVASCGGVRVDDPACDLAVAAALASAATGVRPPPESAFVGEIALTGQLRSAPGLTGRIQAARAAACRTVFAPGAPDEPPGDVDVRTVRHVADALAWALPAALHGSRRLPA